MKTDPQSFSREELEIVREEILLLRSLIDQANARHGSIAALFGGVAGAAVVVAVAINTGAGQRLNGWTLLFGAIALLALLVVIGAACFGLMPRPKGVPNDKTAKAYRARISHKLVSEEPTVDEVLRLQQIFWPKERSSQVALTGLWVMTVTAFIAFLTMFM